MSGGSFDSLMHFAEHVVHMAHQFEHAGHGGGTAGGGEVGGGGDNVEAEILREGAKIIEASIKRGLAGVNVFGLAALASATIAKKGSAEYLRETGALAGSVSVSIGEHEAHIGSNDEKIAFLELGTSRMPPRPVFQRGGMIAEPQVQAMARVKVMSALK